MCDCNCGCQQRYRGAMAPGGMSEGTVKVELNAGEHVIPARDILAALLRLKQERVDGSLGL